MEPEEELRIVSESLARARQFGLEAEVILAAMNYYRSGDNLYEAFRCALYDWDI